MIDLASPVDRNRKNARLHCNDPQKWTPITFRTKLGLRQSNGPKNQALDKDQALNYAHHHRHSGLHNMGIAAHRNVMTCETWCF